MHVIELRQAHMRLVLPGLEVTNMDMHFLSPARLKIKHRAGRDDSIIKTGFL